MSGIRDSSTIVSLFCVILVTMLLETKTIPLRRFDSISKRDDRKRRWCVNTLPLLSLHVPCSLSSHIVPVVRAQHFNYATLQAVRWVENSNNQSFIYEYLHFAYQLFK